MASELKPSPVPSSWISGCEAAHARLHAIVERISDDDARRDTLLEGWTIGHLLTHLARNADSHRGMVEAAQRGEVIAQYPGGPAQRNGDIERGSSRPALDLAADLKDADQKLEHAWSATGERVWATGLGLRRYGPATMAEFVFLRWREVEIHLLDLNLPDLGSPDWHGLSGDYIDAELPELSRNLATRVPESTTIVLAPGDRPSRAFGKGDERIVIEASPGKIVAWLLGRGGEPSWPSLRPWE
jgi:maleylpyruvate isomerase